MHNILGIHVFNCIPTQVLHHCLEPSEKVITEQTTWICMQSVPG